MKIQHFGDNNVQNAIVREVRFLGLKTRLAFYLRATQEKLLHLALGRQSKCRHLKSTGSIAAYLHSEQDHRLWLLVSNSKIQRQKSIWKQVSGSDTAVLLAGHTALAVVVLQWTLVRGQG